MAYHVNRQCNVAEAAACGVKRVRVLMVYYIPWLHYPGSLSTQEHRAWGSDVVFAGHMEPDLRIECLTRVVRAGLKCRIFGGKAEWRSALPRDVYRTVRPILLRPRGRTTGEHFVQAKSAPVSSAGGIEISIRTRSWEIPACGVFLLSERTRSDAGVLL